MKTKKIKMFVVLACMTFGLANIANGQIYSSEIFFYGKPGSDDPVYVVEFDGSVAWVAFNGSIKAKLAEDKDYFENNKSWRNTGNAVLSGKYEYVRSTSTREVYRYFYKPEYGRGWYKYWAFAKDKSSGIEWTEYTLGVVSELDGTHTYTRVPKEDLLPKASSYDFLDE